VAHRGEHECTRLGYGSPLFKQRAAAYYLIVLCISSLTRDNWRCHARPHFEPQVIFHAKPQSTSKVAKNRAFAELCAWRLCVRQGQRLQDAALSEVAPLLVTSSLQLG